MRARGIYRIVVTACRRDHGIKGCVVQAQLTNAARNDVRLASDRKASRRIESEAVSHGGTAYRASGRWIVNLVGENGSAKCVRAGLRTEDVAEISGCRARGRDGSEISLCRVNPRAFVVGEEEYLPFYDRPAQSHSELILLVWRFARTRRFKESTGIQGLNAQELPGASVEVICARLRTGVDDGASAPSKLRRVVRRLNLELSDGIHAAQYGQVTVVVGIVVDAVQHEVVLVSAGSVDGETSAGIAVGRSVAAVNRSLDDLGDPRSERREVRVTPPVQG